MRVETLSLWRTRVCLGKAVGFIAQNSKYMNNPEWGRGVCLPMGWDTSLGGLGGNILRRLADKRQPISS